MSALEKFSAFRRVRTFERFNERFLINKTTTRHIDKVSATRLHPCERFGVNDVPRAIIEVAMQ